MQLPRVLDSLREGFQIISPEYRYLFVNEAVVRHGQTTRDAVIGHTMMEVYPGIDHTEMFSTLRTCMEGGASARMENEFEFPDGSKGWFDLLFEKVPDGVCILSVDITDRKRAELALQRTTRALETLSQCNQTLVRAVDEQKLASDVCRILVEVGTYAMAWITVDGSPPVAAHAGVPEETEIAHATLSEAPWFAGLRDQALAVGGPAVARFTTSDARLGDEVRARDFAACLVLPIAVHGEQIGLLSIYARDADAFAEDELALLDEVALDLGYGFETLRARVAQMATVAELRASQARTRAIFDHLPHATFVWRLHDGRFTLIDGNDAARVGTNGGVISQLGRSAGEAGAGIPEIEADLARCVHERAVIRREVECRLSGATESRWMVLTYGFIPPDGVLLLAQDVTEQRQTREQLTSSQRLEAVGRLAGGVAHDFNNLLTVILTYAGFALQRVHAPDPMRDDVVQIVEAGERAATLTRQLLAFSRRQILEPEPTSLNSVVQGIESMMRRLLGEDIDIGVHLASDLGSVMADPGQLDQVLMNLAVNARDAMPEGGMLTIETANVELDEEYARAHATVEAGPYVRLSVADTGVGMDAETRSRIFEPFFTTKEDGKGTGLGLAMVYGIVKQSGGHIWLYSEPAQGTTFKIYLPRLDVAPVETDARPAPAVTSGSETILVVEDEDAVRRAAERILARAGYTVLTAANGEEALLLCERHADRIALVLSDVVMPKMSGKELSTRLLSLKPGLKVLYMSGYTDNAIVHQGVLDRGTRFIGKPFSSLELTRKVRETLDED